jgi:DNA-binding SARP family transcriptional activator
VEVEQARPTNGAHRLRISLLGRFELTEAPDAPIPVAAGTQRLLGLLALRGRVVHRASIAGALWPEVSDRHALASLRSTLLRIPSAARSAVTVTDVDLMLAEGVSVDFRDAQALAHRLLDGPNALHENDLATASISTLAFDLLPGWTDEWVMNEAEEWRQLRLHSLEALTTQLVAHHRFADATAAAMAAIRAEPLRESAHAALIRVHLAESNQSEARRQFERYQSLLQSELGIEPTPRLRELVGI